MPKKQLLKNHFDEVLKNHNGKREKVTKESMYWWASHTEEGRKYYRSNVSYFNKIFDEWRKENGVI